MEYHSITGGHINSYINAKSNVDVILDIYVVIKKYMVSETNTVQSVLSLCKII